MIRIIALSREYGSGGAVIASEVASALGWELIDRAFIDRIAERADVSRDEADEYDERATTWYERVTKPARIAGQRADRPHSFDPDRMQQLARDVISRVAEHTRGAVVVGRGSQCILHRRDDVLSVFIYAPSTDRLRRLRPRYSTENDAVVEMKRIENERTQFIRHYFGRDRFDLDLYDLLINSNIGISNATNVIVDTVKRLQDSMMATEVGGKKLA